MANVTVSLTLDDGTVLSSSTVNRPDAQLLQGISLFAQNQNYQACLGDGTPNPESKADFIVRKAREYMANVVNAQISANAAAAAQATANANKVSFE
jgi:hypothetical protein